MFFNGCGDDPYTCEHAESDVSQILNQQLALYANDTPGSCLQFLFKKSWVDRHDDL